MNVQHYKDAVYITGQVEPKDIPVLVAEYGFAAMVNNRIDGEAEGQSSSAEIAAACAASQVAYAYIPMRTRDDVTVEKVAERDAFLKAHTGKKVLFFCRTGGRSEALLSR